MLIMLAGAETPAMAAEGVVLAIDPAQVTIPLGNQVDLQLQVRNGVNVNAFDLTLTYDQDRLALASWAHGDYLSNLNCVRQLNQPGRLELACTQVARPAVSGDGVLLDLVFNTLMGGLSEVHIQHAILANPQGATVQPERQHGSVTVAALPTYTPTRTATATRTHTPIPTHTPSPAMITSPTVTSLSAEVGTAYPGQVNTADPSSRPDIPGVSGITRTITATSIATHTLEAYPAQDDDGYAGEPRVDEPLGDVESGRSVQGDQTDNDRLLEIGLWSVLAVSLVLIIVMAAITLKRNNKKDDDYLL